MNKLRWVLLLGLLLAAAGFVVRYLAGGTLSAAEQAYRDGDYARAAELYSQAAAEADDPGHAVFNRAAAFYELGQLDPAASDYRSAHDSGEEARAVRALYDLGNCALRQACAPRQTQVTPLLHDAIRSYEACLQRAAGTLQDDARHNQALAKKLLALQPDAPRPSKEEQARDNAGAPASAASRIGEDESKASGSDVNEQSQGSQPNQSGDTAESRPANQPGQQDKGRSTSKDQQVAKAEANTQKQNTDKNSTKEPAQQCPT